VTTLAQAETIAAGIMREAVALNAAPLTVAVLDAGGHVVLLHRQDGSSILRPQIATGKAYGALGLGISSRAIAQGAESRPHFFGALATASEGRVIPAPGGVLIRENGALIGAVGVTGDNSDVDEACAIAGVRAAGLDPEPEAPQSL
jgi:uncharacterized protein GlcG (DUF336 family)